MDCKKWEQAFRVYEAIYSKANSSRSAEIWHYLYIINTAVSSYAWENVAYYDFTFRQMISHNPNRSWAKLYSHLWNLAITEAIRQIWFPGEHEQHTQKQFHVKQWRKKWQKIKSPLLEIQQKPTLVILHAKYEHKCSYCGMYGHSVLDCTKLFSKKNKNGPKPSSSNHRNNDINGRNGNGQNNQNNAGTLRAN